MNPIPKIKAWLKLKKLMHTGRPTSRAIQQCDINQVLHTYKALRENEVSERISDIVAQYVVLYMTRYNIHRTTHLNAQTVIEAFMRDVNVELTQEETLQLYYAVGFIAQDYYRSYGLFDI